MVKGYSPLEGSQEDINRRFLRRIENLEKYKNTTSKIYSFTSYDSKTKDNEWGTGTVQATGITSGKYMQVEVLTNSVGGFVGQKYYIIATAKTNGSTAYQLYTDAGKNGAGIWVTIEVAE